MSKRAKHTWDVSNIVDDVHFQENDADLFKNLLEHEGKTVSEDQSLMAPGTILKGRILKSLKTTL